MDLLLLFLYESYFTMKSLWVLENFCTSRGPSIAASSDEIPYSRRSKSLASSANFLLSLSLILVHNYESGHREIMRYSSNRLTLESVRLLPSIASPLLEGALTKTHQLPSRRRRLLVGSDLRRAEGDDSQPDSSRAEAHTPSVHMS